MKNDSLIKIHRIFGILLAFSVISAGVCLIGGCLSIYFSGEPYSREAVSEMFGRISISVYICLVLTAVGILLDLVLPASRGHIGLELNLYYVRQRLLAKKDLGAVDGPNYNEIISEQKKRKKRAVILAALIFISSAVFFVYALNANNYHTDINRSVINAMWVLIPCFSASAIYAVFVLKRNRISLEREIFLLKKIPNAENTDPDKSQPARFSVKRIAYVRYAVLLVGLALLIFGFASGGTADVLTKAINICTECIGLG